MNRRMFFLTLPGTSMSASAPLKPAITEDAISWTGETYCGITARALAETVHLPLDPEEAQEALRFYVGYQWPQEIECVRKQAGRPSLVINRLPALVARLLLNDGIAAYDGIATYKEVDRRRLIVAVVRGNRDAQRLHNYLCSAVAERARTIK